MTGIFHRGSITVARRFCLPLALLVLAAASAYAQELTFTLDRVTVRYHSGDAALARQAAEAVGRAEEIVQAKLGIAFRRRVEAHLVRGREEFDRLCGQPMPEWALAAALPERGTVAVDAARVAAATANDLRLTIIHETVHLALAQAESGRADRLPRWFHEGAATWLSGTRHFGANRNGFDTAAMHGALLPLADLEDGFPADARQADLAYLQSEAFVTWLLDTRGPEALRWIMDRYRTGESFDAAFRGALGDSVGALEARWADSLKRSFPWLRVLARSLGFWGALAVATIIIFLVVRRRARFQRAQWEREEFEWSVVGEEEEADEDEEEETDDW